MTLEAELSKNEYLPLEPIPLKFKLTNQTNRTLITYPPNFLDETGIRVTYKGESKEFYILFPVSACGPRSSSEFRPGGSAKEEMILESLLEKYFPEPGYYQVQFLLSGNRNEIARQLETKPITIKIEEPTGTNKDAFDFLKKYQSKSKYDIAHFWGNDEKTLEGQNVLEAFVNKYGSSPYGEYAINSLGTPYLFSGKLDKAKAEFERIKTSNAKPIAENAKRSLIEIKSKLEN